MGQEPAEGPGLKPPFLGGDGFVGLKPYANPKRKKQGQRQIPTG